MRIKEIYMVNPTRLVQVSIDKPMLDLKNKKWRAIL